MTSSKTLLLLVAVACLSGGCRNGASIATAPVTSAPCGWDPTYDEAVFLTRVGIGEEVKTLLWQRERSPAFWGLVRFLVAESEDCRRAIVVERMPAQDGSWDYWCGAIVVQSAGAGGAVDTYRSGGMAVHPVGQVLPSDKPVIRRGRKASPAFSVMWQRLLAQPVWSEPGHSFDITSHHPSPWFIHVFERDRGGVAFWLDDNLEPDMEDLTATPPVEAPEEPADFSPGHGPLFKAAYSRSYPARVALQAALLALSEQD